MSAVLVILMTVAQLGSGFGDAAAEGSQATPTTIEIELTVTLASSPGPVLAHLLLPGRSSDARPLASLGGGRWGSTMEVRRAEYQVVFEDVASGELSDSASLTELGIPPSVLGSVAPRTTLPVAVPVEGTPPWGWLSLAAGATGLAVMLYLYGSGSVTPRHLRRRIQSRQPRRWRGG